MSSKLPSIVSASQSVHICILFCQLDHREVWNHSPEPADSPAVLITHCLRRMKDCLEICCRVLIFFMCNQYLTGHEEADFSGSDGEERSRKPNAKELLINRDHGPLGLCSGASFEVGHRKAT